MRVLFLSMALALVACGDSDRAAVASTQAGTASAYAGPQALVLRVPRAGGVPRVHRYPRVDSLVWTTEEKIPAPAEMLAFDDENGIVAYVDTRGRPVLLDFRLGTASVQSTKKLTGFASANGRAVYGIASNGDVVRLTASGEWTWKPPRPAHAVYPQHDGALLVASGTGDNARLLRIFPPDKTILDSIAFPMAQKTVRTQLGDRLYLAVDSGLVVLRTRTMDWAPPVHFEDSISVMASTPSGDRVFVLNESKHQISVVDRFRDRVTAVFDLPGKADDMRVDPFGRYLLARAADSDSLWVLAIGTQKIIGSLRGTWRGDLPFVGYDGAIATAVGNDVVMYDGETLERRSRIPGGARDIWFQLQWDGFRPRAASLDEPVRFDSIIIDSTAADTLAPVDPGDTTGIPAAPSDTAQMPSGFVVSFAAFLNESRARELANRIIVGGTTARVVTSSRDGTTIYRVILGPYATRDEADRAGRESGQSYWVFEGRP